MQRVGGNSGNSGSVNLGLQSVYQSSLQVQRDSGSGLSVGMTKRIVLECEDLELSRMVCLRQSYWVNQKYLMNHTIIGIVLRLFGICI